MSEHHVIYLSQADVAGAGLSMEEMIRSLETMFRFKGEGRTEMPPKPGIHPQKDAFIHAMPAYIPDMNAAGVKWVAGYPDNYKKGLPYITGLMIMNDTETGLPLVIMDCAWITAMRTGAATAVAAKHLARPDSATLGILGCGVQGESNLEALAVVQRQLKTVVVYDVFAEKAELYAEKMKRRFPALDFIRAASPREAVAGSDMIVTAGPIRKDPEPVIEAAWFREGTFVSTVDFDSYWKPAAMRLSDRFCTDDRDQMAYYKREGYFRHIPEVTSDLGEIAAGRSSGREHERERIMTMNLGLALEDMAVGKIVCERAKQLGLGVRLPL
ncbi:MAG: ornithine cyclodeaminase family protein [Paenibacillaceae bacterium]|nr:ornithine cyclodeaminase family protein [Paenibacillaceae bacterium]